MVSLGHPGAPAGMTDLLMGAKQTGVTPAGRGPAAMYSLSLKGTLPLASASLSWKKDTTPSPGFRTSPTPPHRALVSVLPAGTHARLQVKPPSVDRLTKTPFVSSSRLK